jgi:hypothetical protein
MKPQLFKGAYPHGLPLFEINSRADSGISTILNDSTLRAAFF